MRRRNLDPNTPETPAGNHAFEHLLIDPMNADEEEDKDRQFVTAPGPWPGIAALLHPQRKRAG